MNNTDRLNGLLRDSLVSFDMDMPVSPEVMANYAIQQIDPSDSSPTLVRWGCVLELRQLARAILRKEYEEKPDQETQPDLFEGLQDRYPGFGEHKGMYIPIAMMTEKDFDGNIERFDKRIKADQAHRNALAALKMEMIKAGRLMTAA